MLTCLAVRTVPIKRQDPEENGRLIYRRILLTSPTCRVPLAGLRQRSLLFDGEPFSFFLCRSRSNNLINFHYGYCDASILAVTLAPRSLWQSTLVELIVKKISLPHLLLFLFLPSARPFLLFPRHCRACFCFLRLRFFFPASRRSPNKRRGIM